MSGGSGELIQRIAPPVVGAVQGPPPDRRGAVPVPGSERWSETEWRVWTEALAYAAGLVLLEHQRGRTLPEAANRILAAAEGRQL